MHVRVVFLNKLVSQLAPNKNSCYLYFYAKNLSPNLCGIYKSQPKRTVFSISSAQTY